MQAKKSAMDWQMIIVLAIVLLAVVYVVMRVRRTVKHTDNPCCNCGCCQQSKHKKSLDGGKCHCEEINSSKNLHV